MGHLEGCEKTILYLQNKVKQLEQEIDIKDEAHCQELRLMHKHIEALMNKYCLN